MTSSDKFKARPVKPKRKSTTIMMCIFSKVTHATPPKLSITLCYTSVTRGFLYGQCTAVIKYITEVTSGKLENVSKTFRRK